MVKELAVEEYMTPRLLRTVAGLAGLAVIGLGSVHAAEAPKPTARVPGYTAVGCRSLDDLKRVRRAHPNNLTDLSLIESGTDVVGRCDLGDPCCVRRDTEFDRALSHIETSADGYACVREAGETSEASKHCWWVDPLRTRYIGHGPRGSAAEFAEIERLVAEMQRLAGLATDACAPDHTRECLERNENGRRVGELMNLALTKGHYEADAPPSH